MKFYGHNAGICEMELAPVTGVGKAEGHRSLFVGSIPTSCQFFHGQAHAGIKSCLSHQFIYDFR